MVALIVGGGVLALVATFILLWRLLFAPLYDCTCWACGKKRRTK